MFSLRNEELTFLFHYSGITFAFFFLGEYANILLMSTLFVIFFLGGSSVYNTFDILSEFWQIICFSFKIIFITFVFIFIRANLPRFRFDQLMYIGWKIFLPITLGFVLFFSGILLSFNSLHLLELPRMNNANTYIQIFSVRF